MQDAHTPLEQSLPTRRIAVDPEHPDEAVLDEAAALLRAGGLVAFPTETVYGLGANALDAAAVRRIFTAKGRPAHDPLIVHLSGAGELARVAVEIPPNALMLVERFWPGPLTLVLRRSPAVPDEVTAGGATVAVRAPSHPLAQALIRRTGLPIAAPSANLFSHTSPTTAQHVWDDLSGRIDLILDGGATPIGVESTVLDLSGAVPVLLRPGGVPVEALAALLGQIELRTRSAPGLPLESPGMLDRHYAPHTRLVLFSGEDAAVQRALRSAAEEELAVGRVPVVLAFDEDLPALEGLGVPVERMGSGAELGEVARRLYGLLRAADRHGAGIILARDVPPVGIGAAIRDRLHRAADLIVDVE